MGSFDGTNERAETGHDEHSGIPEGIGDSSLDHAPAASSDGSIDEPAGGTEGDRDAAAASVGIDGPGVPDTAGAAAGPTQATSSGRGPAPAAGQDEAHAGLADSVAESEEGAESGDAPQPGRSADSQRPEAPGEATVADPVTDLAEDLGLAPGATDVLDPGQDNGSNS